MNVKREDVSALYIAEHDRLERQIYHRIGCHATACDLVHDIFLRIWEKAIDWKGNKSAYLTRCARNATIDHIRSEKVRNEFVSGIVPEQYAMDSALPDQILSARQSAHCIEMALANLPKKTRHIFLLNRVYGRSFSDIAEVIGVSQRAVAKHMARAVAACYEAEELE